MPKGTECLVGFLLEYLKPSTTSTVINFYLESPFLLRKLLAFSSYNVIHVLLTILALLYKILSYSFTDFQHRASLVAGNMTMQEMRVGSLGQEDPLEKEMATRFSILAWENPTDRGAWRAVGCRVRKSRTRPRD